MGAKWLRKTNATNSLAPQSGGFNKIYLNIINITYIVYMICICIRNCNCTHNIEIIFSQPRATFLDDLYIHLKTKKNKKTSKFPDVPSWEHVPGVSAALLPPPAGAESAAESLSGGGRGGRKGALCFNTRDIQLRLVVIPRNQRYLMPGCRK